MTTKLRVRDLAADLGITNKDLMGILRNIGVPVRSAMSGLTEEDIERARDRHQALAESPQPMDTLAPSGVIVRKRRKDSDSLATEDNAMSAESEQTPSAGSAPAASPEHGAEEVLPAEPVRPRRSRERTPSQAVIITPAKVIAAPEPFVPADADVDTDRRAGAEPVRDAGHAVAQTPEDTHRSSGQEPAPDTQDNVEPEVKSVSVPMEQEDTSFVDADDSTDAAETQAVSSESGSELAGDEKKQARRKTRKNKPAAPSVQVKVISRPKIVEFPDTRSSEPPVRPMGPAGYVPRPAGPAVRPTGPAADRPTGPAADRPTGPGARPTGPGARPTGPGSRPDATRPAPAAGAEPSRDTSRNKKKKGRRTVEAVDLYRKEEFSLGKGKKAQRAEARRAGKGGYHDAGGMTQPLKASKRKIRVEDTIRLADLAHQMGVKAQDLIKALFSMGVMATINQALDFDTALLVAAEFHYEVENVGFSEDEFILPKEVDKAEDLKPRPPVVTIMGHVDHGKTSLLDAIRSTSVATGEAGGITQHIGAYHVTTHRGEVVFLDTPGHEAFTTMRARGAKVTDIVVLVVAADDGVMEQTREAVSHSKAAGVPIVVAVNKIDKDTADPDRIKRELSDLGLMPEEWGGETIYAHVSAKKRLGLDELLELILLQAEVLDLRANPDKPGRGHIVEARLDKGRGPVGTVLIQEGQINQGDAFVCGLISGKVRAMFDDQGRQIKTAGPAIPAEIQGFESIPEAGDEFVIVKDEKVARKIAEDRRVKHRERELAKESKVTLESFLKTKVGEEAQTLNLLVKADVQGSLEAVSEALNKLSTDEVKISLLHGGAGAITESDILLASASGAIIIGFNIRPTAKIKDVAEQEKVDIRFYDIIYKLVDDVKAAMSGMLSPDIKEVYLGQADVQQTFAVPKVGTIAGCMVSDGKLRRNANIRLLRDGVVIYTGKLSSLKRFKDDAREVAKGYECGAGLENFNDIKVGDIIEAFEHVEEARTI